MVGGDVWSSGFEGRDGRLQRRRRLRTSQTLGEQTQQLEHKAEADHGSQSVRARG
ncbi:Hypothetical predicted protein [Scomber scombrus]|uniref:Uncharacterized protein n=1 Tax=Scomber scombrus TaxID=13677 RepID=A0AAV1PR50_SCOSC